MFTTWSNAPSLNVFPRARSAWRKATFERCFARRFSLATSTSAPYASSPVTVNPHSASRHVKLPGPHAMSSTRRSEEHTSELQSLAYLVCRLLLEKKKKKKIKIAEGQWDSNAHSYSSPAY